MRIYHSNTALLLFLLAGVFLACQPDEEYDAYEPEMIMSDDGSITYDEVITYPLAEPIASEEPTVLLEGNYRYSLGEISAPAGSSYDESNFSIDGSTGVVTYDNSNEDLSPGMYVIDIGVSTLRGIVMLEDALTLEVEEVPLELTVDNDEVFVEAIELGVIATVSVTDNSGGELTSTEFQLVDSIPNFSIDPETGEITKTGAITEVIEDPIPFDIQVSTNLGKRIFENALEVTVGPPPVLTYQQAAGSDLLNSVTLSPWTSYSTSAPTLENMNAEGGFELVLPEELQMYAANFTIDGSGVISISEDAGLPEGTYAMNVIVTNNLGITAEFTDIFQLIVERRWEMIVDDQMEDESGDGDDPEIVYPDVWQQYNNGPGSTWKKKVNVSGSNYTGLRLFKPDHAACDVSLTRALDVSGYKAAELTWGELVGGNNDGNDFIQNYDRQLYYSSNADDIAGGAFNGANWNIILSPDDELWSAEESWRDDPDEYQHIIDLTVLDVPNLIVHWRVTPDAASTATDKQGQWWVDYITVRGAAAFNAEEN